LDLKGQICSDTIIVDYLIMSNEIEAVIKSIPTNRSPRPDIFTAKFLSNL
jgi:hypothetical protein